MSARNICDGWEISVLSWASCKAVTGFLPPAVFNPDLLRIVVKRPKCNVELSIKLAEQDKRKMMDGLHARRATASFDTPLPTLPLSENIDDTFGGTWIKYDKPCLWMYAGKGPYVSRCVSFIRDLQHELEPLCSSLMQFPVSQPDDGLIDLTIQEMVRLFFCLGRKFL